MVAEPPEPASYWDFSQALDLLRSPTRGVTSKSTHHTKSEALDPLNKRLSKNEAGSTSAELSPRQNCRKLGEFGLLWDILNGSPKRTENGGTEDTESTSVNNSTTSFNNPSAFTTSPQPAKDGSLNGSLYPGATKPKADLSNTPTSQPSVSAKSCVIQDAATSSSVNHPLSQSPAVKILKRASKSTCSGEKPTPSTSGSQSPQRKGYLKITKPQSIPTESSSEVESFDRPLSKKAGVLAFVPSQVGASDAEDKNHETQTSSYEDLDSAFYSDASNKNNAHIPKPLRLLYTTYSNETERDLSLMRKLLRDFPEYSQVASREGRSRDSLRTRPIHVFVDMSNVSCGSKKIIAISHQS